MNKTLRKKGAFVVAAATLIVAAALCGNAPAPAGTETVGYPQLTLTPQDLYVTETYKCEGAESLILSNSIEISPAETLTVPGDTFIQYSFPLSGEKNVVPNWVSIIGMMPGGTYSNRYDVRGEMSSTVYRNNYSKVEGSIAPGAYLYCNFDKAGLDKDEVAMVLVVFVYKDYFYTQSFPYKSNLGTSKDVTVGGDLQIRFEFRDYGVDFRFVSFISDKMKYLAFGQNISKYTEAAAYSIKYVTFDELLG